MRVSAQQLREIIEEIVFPYLGIHRGSRVGREEDSLVTHGRMSDDEITDFVLSNPLLDSDTAWRLSDPGLLGYSAEFAEVSEDWLSEFRDNVTDWATKNEWASGDLVYYHLEAQFEPPEPETEIWTPKIDLAPDKAYLERSPGHLLIALNLIKRGKSLEELDWRLFEKVVAELLETNGWIVELMRGTKDGGIDVISTLNDPVLGPIRAIWQAKKYQRSNKVGLSSLREFSGILDQHRATKGVVVTTSSFTRGAIDWVQKDLYRLSAVDGEEMERWIKRSVFET